MENNNKELQVQEQGYLANVVDLGEMFSEEMEGMTPTFERIKVPNGGLAYEVPSDDPESPDMVKEFKAVILHHHATNVYYENKYDGSNNPPECSSNDGKTGVTADGELVNCKKCPNLQFGTSEDGNGKACKQKRRLYILREGELLPTLLTLPTGSLKPFTDYIMRLLNKGKKSSSVVTKFTLAKATNSGGIKFSKAVLLKDRDLDPTEIENISKLCTQVKHFAQTSTFIDED